MLRKLALVLAVATAAPFAVGTMAPTATAQPNPGGFTPSDQPPPDEPPPGSTMRRPEHLTARPSGFWTSTRPAVGGAYRYRIMGMGILALLITGFFVLRMLRKIEASRPSLAPRLK